MAQYVKATNFAVKDSLSSGNPAKIVKGTEIDVEFNAIAAAIASKTEADSPIFTGTPLAPTASTATNNTQIATTAYVVNRIAQDIATPLSLKANIASPTFTGVPTAPTAAVSTDTTQVATTAFVNAEITSRLNNTPLAGNPTAATQSTSDNSTRLATTAYVVNRITQDIAGKANIASPTFTGTPAAPTATYGNNTTQLATTAFVQAALQALYPVGSIYINATNSTNPGTLLGFGTWTAFGAGRVPVGFNASDPLFDTAEETGGSKDATVVSHSHTATSTSTVTDPGHAHSVNPGLTDVDETRLGGGRAGASGILVETNIATTNITVSTSTTVASTGSSGTNANLQPYITVYMWKRTA
jgi:hypothetical protein